MKPYSYFKVVILAFLPVGAWVVPNISQAADVVIPPTFIKLVDTADPVPDRPTGTLFQLFGVPTLDGNRVVFNVSTPGEYSNSIWSIDTSTGLPSLVRLVDTNTPIPQGSGNFAERFSGNPFTSVKAEGGKVVFGGAGTNPENSIRNQSGFYSVPTNGDAITMLVNAASTMPGVTPAATFDIQVGSYNFNLDANNLTFGNAGIYAVPVNGGSISNLGTGFLCTNGYGFPFGVNSYSANVYGPKKELYWTEFLGKRVLRFNSRQG